MNLEISRLLMERTELLIALDNVLTAWVTEKKLDDNQVIYKNALDVLAKHEAVL